MANIDLTKIIGTDAFPNTVNDVLGLVETLASQRIMAVQSANRLFDATYDYDVQNGKVIQEAVIEMAKSYSYNKDAYDRAPLDPTLHVRYFDNYTDRQFETTIRIDDIRKIIANKGQGVEDIVAQILSTLTAGESYEDFTNVRALLLNDYVKDYSTILGGTPKNLKGVIYTARNMYNHLKSDNSDLTKDAFISSTPAQDIRIAMTESLLNLIDVVELANIFNLEKEELFGIMVVIPDSDLPENQKYKLVVYDRKAMGRATFTYDFTQEYVAKGRYSNDYLTVSRAYFFNELFKACTIDCTSAVQSALSDIIEPITPLVFTALSDTDNLTLTPLYVDKQYTAEDGLLDKMKAIVGGDTVFNGNSITTTYWFGSAEETSKPSLYVQAGRGVIGIWYNNVQIYNSGYYNWLSTAVDPTTNKITVPAINSAIGTLSGEGWNGVLLGKMV